VADDGLGVGRGQHDLGGGAAGWPAARKEASQAGSSCRRQLLLPLARRNPLPGITPRVTPVVAGSEGPRDRSAAGSAGASATSPGGDLHPVTPDRAGGGGLGRWTMQALGPAVGRRKHGNLGPRHALCHRFTVCAGPRRRRPPCCRHGRPGGMVPGRPGTVSRARSSIYGTAHMSLARSATTRYFNGDTR
jgi:hypothetical protein